MVLRGYGTDEAEEGTVKHESFTPEELAVRGEKFKAFLRERGIPDAPAISAEARKVRILDAALINEFKLRHD